MEVRELETCYNQKSLYNGLSDGRNPFIANKNVSGDM